jgi:type II secretory pathway component PulL
LRSRLAALDVCRFDFEAERRAIELAMVARDTAEVEKVCNANSGFAAANNLKPS